MLETKQPQPDISQLHPTGDIFLGRRLPEFKFRLHGKDGDIHNLRIVGRYAICKVHHDLSTRAMHIAGSPRTCDRFAQLWHNSFTAYSDRSFRQPEFTIEQIRQITPIRERVVASMAARIQEELPLPGDELPNILNTQKPTDLWPHWTQEPQKFANALDHGCNYQAWSYLVIYQVPQLARPGFIEPSGKANDRLRYLLSAVGGMASKVVPLWDSVIDQVNVYGLGDSESYFKHLPHTDNVGLLKDYIKGYRTTDPPPEPQKMQMETIPYLERGLDYAHAQDYIKTQIPPEEADRWTSQGLSAPNNIHIAQNLKQEHPEISDSFIAWYVVEFGVVIHQGFGDLKPLPPPDASTIEPPEDAVAANWWQPAAAPELEIADQEADTLQLAL